MDSIGIYITHREKTKSEIEKEMKYIAERNIEIERLLREAEKADEELENNRSRFMELAVQYANMEEEI